jgi:hypothetical protein
MTGEWIAEQKLGNDSVWSSLQTQREGRLVQGGGWGLKGGGGNKKRKGSTHDSTSEGQ